MESNTNTSDFPEVKQQTFLILVPVFMMMALTVCQQTDAPDALDDAYITSIEAWHQQRLAALTGPRSWTSLTGLYWLDEGVQSFGSAEDRAVRLPAHAPGTMGRWLLAGDSVTLKLEVDIIVNSVRDSSLFNGGPVRTDSDPDPHLLNYQSIYWMVIQRGEEFGVRIWDTLHPARSRFTEIPHFSADPAWVLSAHFEPAKPGTTMMVDNELGMTVQVDVAGTVHSAFGRDSFSLVAFDGGPEELFLIFSDMTTDITTYSGGRYIYIPRGDDEGLTLLDMNKAYNPPCVFTDYATCLLPPKENFIPVEVTAGEKMYPGY